MMTQNKHFLESDHDCGQFRESDGDRWYTLEQIVGMLRHAEQMLGQGRSIDEAVREIALRKETYDCWRREYGGLNLDQAKRIWVLDAENRLLKHKVIDLMTENQNLKELIKGKVSPPEWPDPDH